MLSGSLSDSQNTRLNVMIWIPQFVRNSQVCHWVTKSLNRSQRLCLCFRICLCLLVVFNIAPHSSNQLSERSYVSTTALRCSEDAEIKTLLTHSLTHSMSDKVTYWSVLDSQKNHQLWGRWWEDRFRYLILCSKRLKTLTLLIIWFLISFVEPKWHCCKYWGGEVIKSVVNGDHQCWCRKGW